MREARGSIPRSSILSFCLCSFYKPWTLTVLYSTLIREMDALTSTLSSLLQLLKSSHPRRGEEGRQLAQDLFPLCYDLPDEQLDLSLSSLFSPESGILVFVKQVADLDEFSDALESSFKFLIAFLKRLEDRASSYSPDLRETALSVFSRARLGKVSLPLVLPNQFIIKP